jgi:hypothetical protein
MIAAHNAALMFLNRATIKEQCRKPSIATTTPRSVPRPGTQLTLPDLRGSQSGSLAPASDQNLNLRGDLGSSRVGIATPIETKAGAVPADHVNSHFGESD